MPFEPQASPMKPWRASPTAMELWSKCPQAFSYRYELGIDEVAGPPLYTGRLMALTLERYLAHCFEHQVASDVTEIEAIARAVFATENEAVGAGLEALEEVVRICGFYANAHYLDLDRIAGVEMWLPPDAAGPLVLSGRQVIGKVDELYFDDEGTLAIVRDAKTNWSVWPEAETREKLQAKVYPLLIAHSFPDVEEVLVQFDFVRFPGAVREVRWTRAELVIERANIEALIAQMQKPGRRPATPGDHCSLCGYTAMCPRFKSAKQSGAFLVPSTQAEAETLLEDVTVLEAGLERRKDALKVWVKDHGPVAKNGVRRGFFETRTPRIRDVRQFVAWCEERQIDPFDYLTLPSDDLKALVKKRKTLAELVDEEVKTRFDARRGEGEAATA